MFGLLVAILAPQTLAAQRLAQLPSAWHFQSVLDSRREGPPLIKSGDYRREGTVLGGVLVGAAGFLLGSLQCADPAADGSPRYCTGTEFWGGAVGLAVGALSGYFVGRSIPKYRPMGTQ
jgi:hypothetical protein